MRRALVKMAHEGDLVPDPRLAFVDPSVGDVGPDLAVEVGFDFLVQGDVLVLAKLCVGLRVAFSVHADVGAFVPLRQGGEDRPP